MSNSSLPNTVKAWPAMINPSRSFVGARFNHADLDADQRALYNNYSLLPADRLTVKQHLEATFDQMITSARELFMTSNICRKCGGAMAKAGSRHEQMSDATQALWDELDVQVDGMFECVPISG